MRKQIAKNISNETLYDLYWNKEMSLREIALSFGYSLGAATTSMHHLFVKRGLPIRSCAEALKLRYKKHPEAWFKNKPMGERHWKWKGGKRKRSDGYIIIYQPRHPRAINNYVLEHVLVWEKTHNKSLPRGWIIHHLNGIRHDNRPENLMATTRKVHEHHTYIKALQARIRELEQLHFSI